MLKWCLLLLLLLLLLHRLLLLLGTHDDNDDTDDDTDDDKAGALLPAVDLVTDEAGGRWSVMSAAGGGGDGDGGVEVEDQRLDRHSPAVSGGWRLHACPLPSEIRDVVSNLT